MFEKELREFMQIMSDDPCHLAVKSESESLRINKTKGLE